MDSSKANDAHSAFGWGPFLVLLLSSNLRGQRETMRKLYCPVCANEIRWRINAFDCNAGARFSAKLGNQIKNAVHSVERLTTPVRAPQIASYLWCPNCTAELEEYNDRQRHLRCLACSLELPALAHFELMEIKKSHPDLYEDDDK